MTKEEAFNILNLSPEFSEEELRRNYHMVFIEQYRKKSAALTMDDAREIGEKITLINEAFFTLEGQEITGEEDLQLSFRHRNLTTHIPSSKSRRSIKNFEEHIKNLLSQGRYGLALAVLEIGINMSLEKDSEISMAAIDRSVNSLGKILAELGLIRQGMRYMNFHQSDLKKAQNFKEYGDYKSAAKYFARELKESNSEVESEELCQHISVCYFLMNDYENALSVIEELLPQIKPKRSIFEGSCRWTNFATALMVSMYKMNLLKGKKIDGLKLRVKYPLCFKYLKKCYGKVDKAWAVIKEFEEDGNKYEKFLLALKSKPEFLNQVDLSYNLEELEENYYDLFELPIKKSLIYNPK